MSAVDRETFQNELNRLRTREKAHTREGDAIAAARRRLPIVEVDATLELLGPDGPVTLLDTFEGRRQLIAYYFMWNPGRPAPEQCEGCTFYANQVADPANLHSRDITFAVFSQGRNVSTAPADARTSYYEALRYRDLMDWRVPWYSAQPSLDELLTGRETGLFHLVCYLRDGDRVFETYWTTGRGVEAMDYSYALMDLTRYGRQEPWEDSPDGWPLVPAAENRHPPPHPGGRALLQSIGPPHPERVTRQICGQPDPLWTTRAGNCQAA
jgi:predicted dithiol-disulfide oxidoreductase (DUF899 family)